MIIDYKIIGERIKMARKRKNLTQEQLSEMLDVSIPYLSRIENGTSKINLNRLIKICEILNANPGELLIGVSSDDKNYLNKELSNILSKCSIEKQRIIYEIAKVIEKNY